MPTLPDKLRDVESEIVTLRKERGVVLDPTGKVLVSKDGTASTVKLNKMESALAKDNVFTHNHPGTASLSFSDNDIEWATIQNVAQVRAVSGRYVYIMDRPAQGWDWTWFRDEVRPLYDDLDAQLTSIFTDKVRSGELTLDAANEVLTHSRWLNIANRLGLSYRRESL